MKNNPLVTPAIRVATRKWSEQSSAPVDFRKIWNKKSVPSFKIWVHNIISRYDLLHKHHNMVTTGGGIPHTIKKEGPEHFFVTSANGNRKYEVWLDNFDPEQMKVFWDVFEEMKTQISRKNPVKDLPSHAQTIKDLEQCEEELEENKKTIEELEEKLSTAEHDYEHCSSDREEYKDALDDIDESLGSIIFEMEKLRDGLKWYKDRTIDKPELIRLLDEWMKDLTDVRNLTP